MKRGAIPVVRTFLSLVVMLGLSLWALGAFPVTAVAQDDEAKKTAIQELLKKAEEEYRLFFNKPRTPFEFWAAIDFEIKTGKYDVAALLIEGLVKLQPTDKTDEKLLEIEEVEGMSSFLRLTTVKQWHKHPELQMEAEQNVKELIDRITQALEKRLSDPNRINKLIGQLEDPSPDVRAWAFKHLKRTKHRASPYLVDALIKSAAEKKKHERLKGVMLHLDRDILPPLREILKAADDADHGETDLRYAILELFRLRRDTSAVPYLWHISASNKYPLFIRSKAKQTLASLLEMPEEKLPNSRHALTQLAENYYRSQVRFPETFFDADSEQQYIKFWSWNKGQMLARTFEKKSVSDMEFFLAMRHAREALDLDPNHKPAQKILLTVILDHTYRNSLDQFLTKPMPPELHSLLATLDTSLLMEVLQQGFQENNLAVILPLVQILGERGETKAALTSLGGSSQGLVKALYYPDRRVQLAAIRALLNLPGDQPATVKVRIVELLEQFLLSGTVPKALVIHTPEGQEIQMRSAVNKAGFQAVLVPDRKQAFARLHQSADFDFIVIHYSYPPKELPFLLSELRSDSGTGLLPVLVLAPPKAAELLKPKVANYRNIFFVSDALITMPDVLKKQMEDAYKLSKAPKFIHDVPQFHKPRVFEEVLNRPGVELSPDERKLLSDEAMDLLWKMGNGTIKNISIHPARKGLIAATQSKDHAEKAIDTLGHLPGAEVQQRLAGLVLNKGLDQKLRLLAASRLHQHILKHSMLLNKTQSDDLRLAHAAADPDLRKQLALILSHLPATGKTGTSLDKFTPAPVK